MSNRKPFESKVSADAFQSLVDYGRNADELDDDIITAQRRGSVSLYNTLCEHGVAYLGDEVGMGKTFQALGVAALAWASDPSARIMVVAPSKAVQQSWRDTWEMFVREKLCDHDNRLADSLLHRPVHPACFCDNLVEFAEDVVDDPRRLFLTRISSFSSVRTSLNARGSCKKGTELKGDEGPTPQQIKEYLDSYGLYVPDEVMEAERVAETFEACDTGRTLRDGLGTDLVDSTPINVEIARQMRALLPSFDLVILDEGHKMRNRGSNIMTRVFSTLLGFRHAGGDGRRLEEQMPRLLSLSATPAHTRKRDIFRVFGFRDSEAPGKTGAPEHEQEDYVGPRMVRRLRLLSGKSKYDYRREEGRAVLHEDDEGTDVLSAEEQTHAELVLALVQKRLARAFGDDRSDLTTTIKTGFLETFESFEDPEEAHEEIDEGSHTDLDDSDHPPDWWVLHGLAEQFAEQFEGSEMPPHPKLAAVERFVRESAMDDRPEKLLIFVRRRASVRELARRIAAVYDECLLEQLEELYAGESDTGEADSPRFESAEDFQRYVHRTFKGEPDPGEIDDLLEAAATEDDEVVRHSRILAAFRSKSEGGAGYGFRDRFGGDGGLSGFFAENRLRFVWDVCHADLVERWETYDEFTDALSDEATRAGFEALLEGDEESPVRNNQGDVKDELLRSVVHTSLLERAAEETEGSASRMSEVCRDLIVKRHESEDAFDEALDRLDQPGGASDAELHETIDNIVEHQSVWDRLRTRAANRNGSVLEGPLADLLMETGDDSEKGLADVIERRDAILDMLDKNLRMSVGIVDLFVAYDRTIREQGGQEAGYAEPMAETFADWLVDGADLRARRLGYRLNETVRIFDQLARKVGVSEDGWFGDNVWSDFEQQEPVQDVMGGSSSRSRVISQFNSPFFPDFVATTSVFREGVDLHLSCQRVWQYGLPHSPGDLEQQSGRIDRYFSQVHRDLMRERDEGELEQADGLKRPGTLEIGYPYVARSIDETQLGRLLRRKLRVQPMMDRGLSPDDSSKEVDLANLADEPVDSILGALARQQMSSKKPYPAENLPEDTEGDGDEVLEVAKEDVLKPDDLFAWLEECRDAWRGDIEVLWQKSDDATRVGEGPLMLLNRTFRYDGGTSVPSSEGSRDQPTTLSITYAHDVRLHFVRLETPLGNNPPGEIRELEKRFRRASGDAGVRLVVGEEEGDRPELWRLAAVTDIPFFAGSAETPTTGFPDQERVFERLMGLMRVTDAIEAAFGREHGEEGLDISSSRVSADVAEAFDGGTSDE